MDIISMIMWILHVVSGNETTAIWLLTHKSQMSEHSWTPQEEIFPNSLCLQLFNHKTLMQLANMKGDKGLLWWITAWKRFQVSASRFSCHVLNQRNRSKNYRSVFLWKKVVLESICTAKTCTGLYICFIIYWETDQRGQYLWSRKGN